MKSDIWATWSIRLGPEVRQKLVELAEYQDRKPPDVIRRLIKQAHSELEQQVRGEARL